MKKVVSILLICIFNLSFVWEANALLSISHFNLGTTIIENFEQQTGEKLTESEKTAFLSGEVYADIGRFYFDKITGVDSDSEKFADELSKFAKSPEEKWFALGMKAHVLQDKETGKFLSGVFGGKSSSYKDYLNRCALLDSYFLQKSESCIFNDSLNESLDDFNADQIISGLNTEEICKTLGIQEDKLLDFINLQLENYSKYGKKYFLTLSGDLIRKTYESLGMKVELSDLQVQANNIIVASAVLATMVGEKIKPNDESDARIERIEKETKELSEECVDKLVQNYRDKDDPLMTRLRAIKEQSNS